MGLVNSKDKLSTLNWKNYNTEEYATKVDLNDHKIQWIMNHYGGSKETEATTVSSIFISPKFMEGGARKKKIETSTTDNKFNKSSVVSENISNNEFNYTSSHNSNSISMTEQVNLNESVESNNNTSINTSATRSATRSANSSANSSATRSANTTLSNSTVNTNDLNIISHPTTAH